MAARFTPAPALDTDVAATFALPAVLIVGKDIEIAGKITAPVDTGRLRYEIAARTATQHGSRVEATVDSHAVNPADGYDYAGINEVGGAHHRAQRYMGRAVQQVARERGLRTDAGRS